MKVEQLVTKPALFSRQSNIGRVDESVNARLGQKQTSSKIESLQLKLSLLQEKETGFLPKLDSRLSVALTALNNNEKQPRDIEQRQNASLAYSKVQSARPSSNIDI